MHPNTSYPKSAHIRELSSTNQPPKGTCCSYGSHSGSEVAARPLRRPCSPQNKRRRKTAAQTSRVFSGALGAGDADPTGAPQGGDPTLTGLEPRVAGAKSPVEDQGLDATGLGFGFQIFSRTFLVSEEKERGGFHNLFWRCPIPCFERLGIQVSMVLANKVHA